VNCRGAIASGHLRIDLLQSIHAVVDNYATPKHRKVRWRLAQHPRWTFHFTPTSASLLNAAESFFAKLTNRRLKRGVFRSVNDLKDTINCRIAAPAAFPGSASTDAYCRPSADGGR
jgi:transposase